MDQRAIVKEKGGHEEKSSMLSSPMVGNRHMILIPNDVMRDYVAPYLTQSDIWTVSAVNKDFRDIFGILRRFTLRDGFNSQIISSLPMEIGSIRIRKGAMWCGSDNCNVLCAALQENQPLRTLRTLDLRHNHIGDEGAQALAKALQTNQLQALNLGFNHIGNDGAEALAKALQTNQSLHKLDLSNNNIGDEGAEALAKALQTNRTLRELILWWGNIGTEGAKALRELENTTCKTRLLPPPPQEFCHEDFQSMISGENVSILIGKKKWAKENVAFHSYCKQLIKGKF